MAHCLLSLALGVQKSLQTFLVNKLPAKQPSVRSHQTPRCALYSQRRHWSFLYLSVWITIPSFIIAVFLFRRSDLSLHEESLKTNLELVCYLWEISRARSQRLRYKLYSLKWASNAGHINHTLLNGFWFNEDIFFVINRSWIFCQTHDINCRNPWFASSDQFWYSEFKTPLNFLSSSYFWHSFVCASQKRTGRQKVCCR